MTTPSVSVVPSGPPGTHKTPTFRPPSIHTPSGRGDPCTLVILGATGDLAKRKLLPAVYDLVRLGLAAERFQVVGVDRGELSDDAFRDLVRQSLSDSDEIQGLDETVWSKFASRIFYQRGDLTDDALYRSLGERLSAIESRGPRESANRMFYLAVPPSIFETIVAHLSASRLVPRITDPAARPWARVIVEKPFGRSLATAQALSRTVLDAWAEHQVFRIDHYLGKETVQNLLVFRSANLVFEQLWNRQYISHVQITAAETVGVEQRGKYYEEAGVVRDMFQNHLFQLVALTAMELPHHMNDKDARDEKVKVLRAVRPLLTDGPDAVVRAQYTSGTIKGTAVPGYREEPNVTPDSVTPTYAAMRVMIDNHRWKGVPFYVRSGKRMARRATEIAIQFNRPAHEIFEYGHGYVPEPNVLVIRVQPDDGIAFRFEVKLPGAALALTPEIEVSPVEMNFNYADAFGALVSPAYETLLLDCMLGDATLFTRTDEVEAAWRLTDPLLDHWASHRPDAMPGYAAGSWGPPEADALIARAGHRWRTP